MSDVGGRLQGIGVSAGIAIGPIARMGAPIADLPAANGEVDAEVETARATRALDDIADDLGGRQDRASDPAAAKILAAQVLMARDPALRSSVAEHITTGLPAAHAIDAAIGGFQQMLAAAGEYMAERVADLEDIRNRAVARLLHLPMPGIPKREQPFVLVADDLAPADTVDLTPGHVLGLVTERGGPTSHTAIIAKALGLPAAVSCPGILEVPEGELVIVDGAAGSVDVAPSADAVVEASRARAERERMLRGSTGPGRTKDGHAVKLMVNFGGSTDIAAVSADAEGIGLFRTEFLFLDRTEEPSGEEQEELYREVFEAFADRKVVVRTLDVGADKPIPFVDPGPGDNPALGLRGYRLGTLNEGLIERQLEAIARAAKDGAADVSVMAPMVATIPEAAAFVELAHASGLAQAGVMVEVPSLALQAPALLEVVDFVSIGTNDLSQYTYAADRLVGELGELLDPWQPGLLGLVDRTISAARDAGKPVGICGEAASDPLLALVLTGMGVTSLSMAPTAIPEVRASLAARTLAECQTAAAAALAATTPAEARRAVTELVTGETT